MARSIGEQFGEAWERVMTLSAYGWHPMTVGWYRGKAYVYRYNWRLGSMQWMPFKTSRPITEPKSRDMFESAWLLSRIK